MSCSDHDDTVFVQVRKADRKGRTLQNINIPLSDLRMDASDVDTINALKYLGPTGVLQASHRNIDIDIPNMSWTEHGYSRSSPVLRGKPFGWKPGFGKRALFLMLAKRLFSKCAVIT